jgi:saccharopine dehydrogenase-like NADP-dependent oxidoreductase
MHKVLVLGAGRSSKTLITYLLERSARHGWSVIVGDKNIAAAESWIGNHACGKAIKIDLDDQERSREVIALADVVISLLPASLHFRVAELCLSLRKHLLTASYVTEQMKSLHAEAKANDLLFLNECGLDPGIDHMSAMEVIDKIRAEGGEILSFESFAGGLIAPQTDPENPWRYKFTWNPRNVVTAGQQGEAEFLKDGHRMRIPYRELFQTITPVAIPGLGAFEGYPNRDSLRYKALYGLPDVHTMLRGTLRYSGFCSAWNVLVRLGCCSDRGESINCQSMTHFDFLNYFLEKGAAPIKERLARQSRLSADSHEVRCLEWSGLFQKELIGLKSGTPAEILEHILMKRWKLDPNDKDLVIMWHQLTYRHAQVTRQIQTCLTVIGKDSLNTAMALTVGMPLGIAATRLLENKIESRGVVIPVKKEFYEPILHELSGNGVTFRVLSDGDRNK